MLAAPQVSMAMDTVSMLLSQKEEEVARMRLESFRALETQLAERERQLEDTSNKLLLLQQDFEYNLQLLDGRDEELERYDAEFANLGASLADKDRMLAEYRSALAELESEVTVERARARETEAAAQAKRRELEASLAQARCAGEEALLRQREEFALRERALEREVAEARSDLERQWRELSAGFEDQLRRLEVEYTSRADQATEAAQLAQQLAAEREAEAAAAHAAARTAQEAAAGAAQEARAGEKGAKALAAELERVTRTKDARIAHLEQDCQRLQQQIATLEVEHKGHVAELMADVDAMKLVVAEQRQDAEAAAQRAQRETQEQLSNLRARLAVATEGRSEVQAQLLESQAVLKGLQRELTEQAENMTSERDAAVNDLERRLAELTRQRDREVQEAKQEAWAKAEEATHLRRQVETLKATLDERRKDVASYKEQLVAAGERERELQRRLTQAALEAEEALDNREVAVAAENEGLIRSLIEQRDAANGALADAEGRCAAKDEEIALLRQEHSFYQGRQRGHSPSQGLGASPQGPLPSQSPGKLPPSRRRNSPSPDHPGSDPKISNPPDGLHMAGPRLTNPSNPTSQLPTPSTPSPPASPQSGAAFWLGPAGPTGHIQGLMSQAAAMRYSASPRASWESLSRPPSPEPPSGLHRGLGQQPGEVRRSWEVLPSAPPQLLLENQQLKATLDEAESENIRLRAGIAAMRADMETLQPPQPSGPAPPQAAAAPAGQTRPPLLSFGSRTIVLDPAAAQAQAAVAADASSRQAQAESQHDPPPAGPQDSTAQQPQQLQRQLELARGEVECLAAENERLMEMSNELRAERDRATMMAGPAPGPFTLPQLPPPPPQGYAPTAEAPTPPQWLPAQATAQSLALGPPHVQVPPFLPPPWGSEQGPASSAPHWQLPQTNVLLGYGMVAASPPYMQPQQWQQQQPLGSPSPDARLGAIAESGFQAPPDRQPPAPVQAGPPQDAESDMARRLQRIESLAQQISRQQQALPAGSETATPRERSPVGAGKGSGSRSTTSKSVRINEASALEVLGVVQEATNADGHPQNAEIGVEGSQAPTTSSRPNPVPASQKSTPSQVQQKARLKVLQQQRQKHVPLARVRNYNERDPTA